MNCISSKKTCTQVLVGGAVALLVFSSISLVIEKSERCREKSGSKEPIYVMSYLCFILTVVLVISLVFLNLLVEQR